MKAILSIKPQYANQILSGRKTYEFRRKIFKRPNVDTLVIYSTLPQGAVVGEVHIETILEANPLELWEKTHEHGGISKDKFMEYFKGSSSAYAIKLGDVRVFNQPLGLQEYAPMINRPPQSFAYLS